MSSFYLIAGSPILKVEIGRENLCKMKPVVTVSLRVRIIYVFFESDKKILMKLSRDLRLLLNQYKFN